MGDAKKAMRKGTGFVNTCDMPDTSEDEAVPEPQPPPPKKKKKEEEDEEKEEEKKKKKKSALSGGSDGGKKKKKVGGLSFGAEPDEVKNKVNPKSAEAKDKMRKGTGFVNVCDLPDSDED